MGNEEESCRRARDTNLAELLCVILTSRSVSWLQPVVFPIVSCCTSPMSPLTDGPTVGQQIRRARQRKELTQLELARLTKVSRETVGNWENDRTSPDGALPRIEEALDITLGEEAAEKVPEEITLDAALDRLRVAERAMDQARSIIRQVLDRPKG